MERILLLDQLRLREKDLIVEQIRELTSGYRQHQKWSQKQAKMNATVASLQRQVEAARSENEALRAQHEEALRSMEERLAGESKVALKRAAADFGTRQGRLEDAHGAAQRRAEQELEERVGAERTRAKREVERLVAENAERIAALQAEARTLENCVQEKQRRLAEVAEDGANHSLVQESRIKALKQEINNLKSDLLAKDEQHIEELERRERLWQRKLAIWETSQESHQLDWVNEKADLQTKISILEKQMTAGSLESHADTNTVNMLRSELDRLKLDKMHLETQLLLAKPKARKSAAKVRSRAVSPEPEASASGVAQPAEDGDNEPLRASHDGEVSRRIGRAAQAQPVVADSPRRSARVGTSAVVSRENSEDEQDESSARSPKLARARQLAQSGSRAKRTARQARKPEEDAKASDDERGEDAESAEDEEPLSGAESAPKRAGKTKRAGKPTTAAPGRKEGGGSAKSGKGPASRAAAVLPPPQEEEAAEPSVTARGSPAKRAAPAKAPQPKKRRLLMGKIGFARPFGGKNGKGNDDDEDEDDDDGGNGLGAEEGASKLSIFSSFGSEGSFGARARESDGVLKALMKSFAAKKEQ